MRAKLCGTVALVLMCSAAAKDETESYRTRFALADRLEVTSAKVEDLSPVDGPVRIAMRCHLLQAGTYVFHFDAVSPKGAPMDLKVVSPKPPPSRFSAVLPGGIHGGPPRPTNGDRGPTVTRGDADPDQITVRWAYNDLGGRGGLGGAKLAKVTFTAAATSQPATLPSH